MLSVLYLLSIRLEECSEQPAGEWFWALGGFSWFSHALVHGLAPGGPAEPPPSLQGGSVWCQS